MIAIRYFETQSKLWYLQKRAFFRNRMMFGNETYEAKVSPQFAKAAAESIGISALNEAGAREIAEEVTSKLVEVIELAKKFTQRGRRRKLTADDFDRALRQKNVEPLYGFCTPDLIPFRFASGGGRELFFSDEREIELNDVVNGNVPKSPFDVTLKAHWLAIDGIQPAVPENPASATAANDVRPKGGVGDKVSAEFSNRMRRKELVNLQTLTTHELSVEQQAYFKEVTEGCVGSDEAKRVEALQSLASDTGLQALLPRLTVFLCEGVKCNVIQHNLALLIYLMRMVKALTENSALNLEKHLHEFITAVLSCVLGRVLCAKPDTDNHWALREFAGRLLVHLVKQYANSVNCVQQRVTQLLASCWQSDSMSFATHHGAVYALVELGMETSKLFVLPKVVREGERIGNVLMENSANASTYTNSDRVAAKHLRELILKFLRQYVKAHKSNMTDISEFRSEFGPYFGPLVQSAILQGDLSGSFGSVGGVTPILQQRHPSVSSITSSATNSLYRTGSVPG